MGGNEEEGRGEEGDRGKRDKMYAEETWGKRQRVCKIILREEDEHAYKVCLRAEDE